ncbi:MAG: carbohydrate-binding domain-containing protein, partial [Clostridia bacterium]|nr:carbohydrate-binding domain-containing protein [Clostridia bacterium]
MKTKSKSLLMVFLIAFALICSAFAITSLKVNAVATDPTKVHAETIYVGGVELGLGQYVKNGETTATTGEPAEDTTGFAWYTEDGTLVLVDYTYQGKGYEYSSGKYALVYSTGTLHVSGSGENILKQTQSYNMGIYSVGTLTIAPMGTLTIEGDNCGCLYSNNEIIFDKSLGKVYVKSTGNARAIVSYDNDDDGVDEQAIIVNGGDIYVETFYSISDLIINYGALKISSPQNALDEIPNISNYDGGYTLTVSKNEDGSNPTTYNQDTITTFDTSKISDYKYLRLAPPAKTVIESVSVSNVVLPAVGEGYGVISFNPESYGYGGNYVMDDICVYEYIGENWDVVEESELVVQYGVKYKYEMSLVPNDGYTFSEDITNNEVLINNQAGLVGSIKKIDAFTSAIKVCVEFTYTAPPITSIEIRGVDLPKVGGTSDDMQFTPDRLYYGGEYKMVGRSFEKFDATEWVDYNSDGDVLEYNVKYRVGIVLAPSAGFAFANSITSADVTINGKPGVFETLIEGVGYAVVYYEFIIVPNYGITIAGVNGSTTVEVLITPENYQNPLGNGKVSFNPETNTLTLNGYSYEGEGFDDVAISCDINKDLTINLVGQNTIKVTSEYSAGIVSSGTGNLIFTGDGSLAITATGAGIVIDESTLTVKGGTITVNAPNAIITCGFKMKGGNLTTNSVVEEYSSAFFADDFLMAGGTLMVNATGEGACALHLVNFIMSAGYLKINSDGEGVYMEYGEDFYISGGTIEISVKQAGGSFVKFIEGAHTSVWPYINGEAIEIGSENEDGSNASEIELDIVLYKYVKITVEISYGILIADSNDNGVMINETNCQNVLGDGTVSYDPTTNTLTLNNYEYEGAGFVDGGARFGILVPVTLDELTIVLKGENVINVTSSTVARLRMRSYGIYIWETDVVIKGDGSLVVSAIDCAIRANGEDDSSLEIKSGNIALMSTLCINTKYFKMSGGNLDLRAVGEESGSAYVFEFKMSGGNLKILSDGIGVDMWRESDEDKIPIISGGTLEISVAVAGMAFCYYDYDSDLYVAVEPNLVDYVDDYNTFASAMQDGSETGEFNKENLSSYKYLKIAPISQASDNNGLGTGAIVGIVAGSVAVVGV